MVNKYHKKKDKRSGVPRREDYVLGDFFNPTMPRGPDRRSTNQPVKQR